MTDTGVSALVGAVGGAGTTRLALEFGATLARDGRSVLVVDAAYATQGLSTAVPGRIEADVTAVVTEDRPLEAATYSLDVDWGEPDDPGTIAVAPVRAPFERFSRAKTSDRARRLASRLAAATEEYDHVLVDVAPVAANQAVAAVTAADRVVLVVPDSQRGADAIPRMRDRLVDVDAAVDAVVTNRATDSPWIDEADAAVPESETTALPDAPVAVAPSEFATAVGTAAETTFGVELDLVEPESSSLADYLG
jgi:cellulose biosynthesis protein BcsQ